MAKQQFNIRFDFEANMNQVKTAVADLQKSLQEINLPSNLSTNFEKIFGKLNTEMTNFEALTKSSFTNMADVSKAQNAFGRIQKLLNQLGIESTKIKGLDPNKLIPSGVAKRVEDLTAKWASLDAQSKKKDSFAQKIKVQKDAIKDQEREINKLVIKRKALADQNQALGLQKGTQSGIKNSAEKELDKAVAKRSALEGQKGGKSSAEYAALGQEITRLGKVIGAADTEITRLTTSINRNKASIIDLDGKIDVAKQDMDGLQQEFNEMQGFDIDVEELTKLRQELASILGLNLDEVSTDLEKIKEAIANIPSKELAEVAQNGERVSKAMQKVDNAAEGAALGVREVVKEGENAARAASEMENLKNQVLQFFSIGNSIQLFKRAVTSALNTVKELDATMTEAAVVTNFSIGDMWEKLPEYSAQAQKLGVSINDMYQATTLYYQQGLKNNEAMALGVETMKMARIAGMESAQATEAMTAALRGFNMELNETSAVRVNDVYSQLAAVTAADTEQIAKAMYKTASIADAANMEFETTAALLAQIIETTQEAPETAGTALKTIIARFSEVKSLRDQGVTTGEDSEGEIIDVNGIQTALRTVGISMDGFFAGTEGLDSVLLKLAEKWDTLDFETQRYIATMAAGSRQQSRFIAMMSDYERTTELVESAQNSAGASQQQFAKTMESMEAKLQKLKNAWDEFVMGLTNNEILKWGVDFLTTILEGINKLTNTISGGNGLVKSLVTLMTVILALKTASSGLNLLFGTPKSKDPTKKPTEEEEKERGRKNGQQYQQGWNEGVRQVQTGQAETTNAEPTSSNQRPPQSRPQPTTTKTPEQWKAREDQIVNKKMAAWDERQGYGEQKTTPLDADFDPEAPDAYERFIRSDYADQLESDNKKLQDPKREAYQKRVRKQAKKRVNREKAKEKRSLKKQNKGQEAKDKSDSANKNIKETGEVLEQTGKKADNLGEKMQNVGEKTKEAGQKTSDAGQNIKTAGDEMDTTSKKTDNAGISMSKVGTATMAAGGAALSLAAAFRSMGPEFEGVAQVCEVVGSVLMVVGMGLTMVSTIAPIVSKVFQKVSASLQQSGRSAQLSWWWVIIIVAVVVALVAGIIALANHAKNNSLEKQMEAAAQATEDAKAAAEGAKQAYEELLSDKTEYQEVQDKLKSLTKGTEEWKEALLQANSQVLDLITKYPELAQYMERGEQGQLTISEEGWQEVTEAKNRSVKNSTAAVFASQLKETELKEKKARKTLQEKLSKENIGSSEAAIEKVHQAYVQQGPELFNDVSALQELASASGFTVEALQQMQTAMVEYENTLAELENQKQAQMEGAIMAQVSDETAAYDFSGQVVTAVARANKETQADREAEIASSLYSKDGSSESKNNQAFKDLAEEYGLSDKDFTGKDKDDLEILYAKMAGISRDEIAEGLKGDKEALKKEIAKMQATKKAGKAADDLAKKMSKLEISKQQQYAALMSGDGTAVKRSQLRTLSWDSTINSMYQDLGYGSLEDMAKAQGYTKTVTNEDGTIKVVGDVDAMKKAMKETQAQGEAAYKAAFAEADKYMAKGYSEASVRTFEETFGQELGLDQIKNLTGSLAGVAKMGGNFASLVRTMPQLTQGLNSKEKEQAMNILTTASWETQEDIDATVQALRGLGAEIGDNLVDQLYETAKVVKEVNFEKVVEQLKSLKQQSESIWGRNSERIKIYSDEEKAALVEGGISEKNFVQLDMGEWASLSTTNELLSSIQGIANQILRKTNNTVDENIAFGEKIANIMDNKYKVGSGRGKTDDTSISGKQLISELKSGKRDVLNYGTDYNIGVYELERLALDMGFTKQQVGGRDALSVIDMIVTRWENYYGEEGSVYAKNLKTKAEANRLISQQHIIDSVGSKKFYEQYEESNKHLEKFYNLMGDFNEEVDGVLINIHNKSIVRGILGDDQFITRYQGESKDKIQTQMRDIADQIGMKNVKNLTYEELYTSIKDYFTGVGIDSQGSDAESTLDAYINSRAGLLHMMENFEKDLEGSDFLQEKSELDLKVLTVAANETIERFQGVNEVIADQAQYLREGQERSAQYAAALENIASTLSWALGEDVATGFIEQNKVLLNVIAEGGENAAEAYEQLMWNYVAFQRGITAAQLQATTEGQILMGLLETYKEGQAANLNAAITGLTQLAKMSREEAIGFLKQWFSVVEDQDGNVVGVRTEYSDLGLSTEADDWENPYDKFYNTLEEINEAMRQREKLERQYQKLIEKGEASANKLTEKKNQQLAALQREAELQNDIIAGREDQINNLIKEKGLSQYAYLGKNEFTGKSELRINWDEINKISGSKKGEEVQDYISKLEEWFGSIEEAEDSLEEIEDNTDELKERGKDEYLDLEQTIKDALIDSYQKQIDELSNINDSINDANSKMLEAMQEQINTYRQSRDNEKTENQIADKQARLAYLQQNTSGANATEILQLEKEIADAQEGHIDNLIDQKINELQQQNDKAAEQRERQISIAEAQLEQYETSGEIWNKVNELMRKGLNPDTGLVTSSKLADILKSAANFEGLSKMEKADWLTDTNNRIADALSYLQALDGKLEEINLNKNSNNNPDLTSSDSKAGDSEAVDGLINGLTKDEIKDLQERLQTQGLYKDKIDGLYGKNTQAAVKAYFDNQRIFGKTGLEGGEALAHMIQKEENMKPQFGYGFVTGLQSNSVQDDLEGAHGSGGLYDDFKSNKPGITVSDGHVTYRAFKDRNGVPWVSSNPLNGQLGTIFWKGKLRKINHAFKTGGLADYTGPAWLDGTKSKPELVLNARDTQNFIQLKDILASLMSNTPSKTSEKSGDMNFDIDINVETINDETDLDMIANYIENKIVSSANYRNNTIVGGHR